MAKIKHRALSVLLTLCMVVVLCAGMVVAAPVRVKAAITGYNEFRIMDFHDGSAGFEIVLEDPDDSGHGIKGGLTVEIWDGTTLFTYTAPKISYSLYATKAQMFASTSFFPTLTYDQNKTYEMYIPDGFFTGPGDEPYYIGPWGTSRMSPAPSSDTPPAAHGTRPTAPMAARHYDYWLPVYTRLMASGNTGTVTVDTAGADIIYVKYFVFEALKGTNRTLVVQHAGATYRINGRSMAGITLGQNHLFVGNLDGYRV